MRYAFLALALAGYYPFYRAWRANRRTSLAHAVLWATAAWTLWAVALLFGAPGDLGFDPWRYVALCASGAAGVAVLGARRPGVTAWNFVVAGLLAVMLLPLGENIILGAASVTWPRLLFLGATLLVAVLNYAFTRLAIGALVVGSFTLWEFLILFGPSWETEPEMALAIHLALFALPWICLEFWTGPIVARKPNVQTNSSEQSAFDERWLDFRDRYGLFWGQRVREQYNNAARQAGLLGYLAWRGWRRGEDGREPTKEQWREMLDVLRTLLKRFL